jgi:hypothetical protein
VKEAIFTWGITSVGFNGDLNKGQERDEEVVRDMMQTNVLEKTGMGPFAFI